MSDADVKPAVEQQAPSQPMAERVIDVSAEVQKEVANSQAKMAILVDEDGIFRPKTIDEGFRLAKAYWQSKMLPKSYTSPEMVLTAMQFALELGLKPLTGLRQIAVVNGSPCVWGDLPLALCYQSGKLEWIKEHLVDKDMRKICFDNGNLKEPAHGALCQVKRKGDPEIGESFFSIDDAKNAGLMRNDVWVKYTKDMLKYKSRSRVLKGKFPDALNGIAIAEYDHDTHGDVINAEVVTAASSMRALPHTGGEAADLAAKLHVS